MALKTEHAPYVALYRRSLATGIHDVLHFLSPTRLGDGDGEMRTAVTPVPVVGPS